MRILIISSSSLIRDQIKSLLHTYDPFFEILHSPSIFAAQSSYMLESFDILFLDLGLMASPLDQILQLPKYAFKIGLSQDVLSQDFVQYFDFMLEKPISKVLMAEAIRKGRIFRHYLLEI